MIKYSQRLKNVHRVFDPYYDRTTYIRLDRNEDPVGYNQIFFESWKNTLTVNDIAAYADSTTLVEKLSKWLSVNKNEIYITAGSDALIKNIFEVYIDNGDIILLQKPSWRMYNVYSSIYGADVQYICYDSNFSFDVNKIIEQLEGTNVKMIVLANPNQPTGTLIKCADMENILSVAHKRNVLVVIDEAYHLFTDVSIIDYIKMYNNLIVARTFSKAFGLAGLRIGYAVASSKIIQDLMLLRPVTDANSLAINFANYLLDNINVVLDKINDFNKGRDYLFEELNKNNVKCYKSHANFLLIPCLNEENANNLILLAKNKKYLLKGPFKEEPINNYIRITTGPLYLMRAFWEECGDIILQYSVKNNNLTKEEIINVY